MSRADQPRTAGQRLAAQRLAAQRLAVIGCPIAHSLSPHIHQYWLDHYQIPMRYEKIEIAPRALHDFLTHLEENNFYGINLTLPHKQTAYHFACDQGWQISRAAARAQSINIIARLGNKGWRADSSDGEGFFQNLIAQNGFDPQKPITIIGAGGAAAAIALCLADKGATAMRLTNRTSQHAQQIAEKMKQVKQVEIIPWQERNRALTDAHLLIQTSSLGQRGQPPLDLDLNRLPKHAVVADIVYQPLMTDLLIHARQRGNPIIDGLGMLLAQAQIAFEGWFDLKPDITPELREILENKL